ncbi:chromate resistance protein ChrB domain-containing protein [Patescibacteria group bacterium]
MTESLIVTHQNPDVDAIGSAWLLKRFDKELYRSAKMAFVPSGERITNEEVESYAINLSDVVHVDTGGGEFDHHDEEGVGSSASKKVYEYLCGKFPDLKKNKALKRVVEFANDTDQFSSYFWPDPANDRYVFGIEQMLNGFKLGGHGGDSDLVAFGMDCFDGAYSMLNILVEAEKEIKEGTEFECKWGKSIGLLSSNDATIKLAQKMGYNVVVRKDTDLGNIRIKAAPLPEIDLAPIYEQVMKLDKEGTWYFHPGKHMLLNGSRKHLGQKPSGLSLEKMIEIIKEIE